MIKIFKYFAKHVNKIFSKNIAPYIINVSYASTLEVYYEKDEYETVRLYVYV